MNEIIPAVLSHTRAEALERLKLVSKIAKTAQIDICDGHFVPSTTILPRDLANTKTKLKLEFHLMVLYPEHHLHDISHLPQSKTVIVHIESMREPHQVERFIAHAKFHKLKVGIALKPETPAAKIKPYLKFVDQVTVMTVHPGFMGAAFIDQSKKIKQIRAWNKKIPIEVDGGIHHGTLGICKKAGANLFVVGSALAAKDLKKNFSALMKEMK